MLCSLSFSPVITAFTIPHMATIETFISRAAGDCYSFYLLVCHIYIYNRHRHQIAIYTVSELLAMNDRSRAMVKHSKQLGGPSPTCVIRRHCLN
ncbi:hypothetical protein K504DRAFT_116407 [Pleomassaria siparia CBS 279.74]|uniref:Uncharacterized protein n=1 Tax=Pleomassaria siparia CBS 279.74 TaxID=1314801 RepID=A0A6G1JWB2_9PLEO|nr:hypothetical protein K504DRAFT_116407 [Pleomassaria siparia CBS 279.74]